MNIENNSFIKSDLLSKIELKKNTKKSMLRFSGVSLSALLLAACGGGASPSASSPQAPEAPTDFNQNGNTFTASNNDDNTLSQSGSASDLTVISGSGNDTINTGSGNDMIMAGEGGDTINAGAGDDLIVIVGKTAAGQYTSSAITGTAGTSTDLSGLMDLADINGQTASDVGTGETIDGGTGNNTLVIFGTTDLSDVTITNIDTLWVNSDVTLSQDQFSTFTVVRGDGGSVLRVERAEDERPITINLHDYDMQGVAELHVTTGDTIIINSSDDVQGIEHVIVDHTNEGSTISLVIEPLEGETLTVNLSDVGTTFSDISSIALSQGVTLVIDSAEALEAMGSNVISGVGTVVIEGEGLSSDAAASIVANLDLSEGISLVNPQGETFDTVLAASAAGGDVSGSSGADMVVGAAGEDIVTTGDGNDTVIAGAGDDTIRAGEGSDVVSAGDGNDTIVVVGTTTEGQYSADSVTNSAGGEDMSAVLSADDLNNNATSEAGSGEFIDGGEGTDTLVIYGTTYLDSATITNIEELLVNSEVVLTGEQFSSFQAIVGDGSSVVRVRANELEDIDPDNDPLAGVHGNNGHGNNTDGQDDDNPGQGGGGPNVHIKDGDDEDEGANGNQDGTDDTSPDGAVDDSSNEAGATVIDISDTYMRDIGTLSLEGEVTLVADDMHDLEGIANIVGNGTGRILLNGNDDVEVTELNLSEVNFSGIAELELGSSFHIIADNPSDFFTMGSIVVSNDDHISFTLGSAEAGGLVTWDLSDNSLAGIDEITLLGTNEWVLTTFDQVMDSGIDAITVRDGGLSLNITGPLDALTDMRVSDMEAIFNQVDQLTLGENVIFVIDDFEAFNALDILSIQGSGKILINDPNATDDQIIDLLHALDLGDGVQVEDAEGNGLDVLLPTEVLESTAESETLTLSRGPSTVVFGENFGNDMVENFEQGMDVLDLSAFQYVNLDHITQNQTDAGLELSVSGGTILLAGFTGELSYEDFKFFDTVAPALYGFNASSVVDMDAGEAFTFAIYGYDDNAGLDSGTVTLRTPSGETQTLDLNQEVGGLYGNLASFDATVLTEEGRYEIISMSLTDNAGNVTVIDAGAEMPADGIANDQGGVYLADGTGFLVLNSAAETSTVISGTSGADELVGTQEDDIFVGRGGDDIMEGEGDDDTFYFSGAWGDDTITDFELGDRIDLSGADFPNGYSVLYTSNGAVITAGDDSISLHGFTGVLVNRGTYSAPIFEAMTEEERLDSSFDGDVRPPTINSITFDRPVMDLDSDNRIYIDIDVEDDMSGAQWLYLRFEGENGETLTTWLYADQDFEQYITMNEWAEPVTFTLVQMSGYDFAGNHFNFNAENLVELGLDATFEVTNVDPDTVNPVIEGITLPSAIWDLGVTDTFLVEVNATDDLSGVDRVFLRFTGPDGDHVEAWFYPETGLTTALSGGTWDASGIYELTFAKIYDNAHHLVTLSGDALVEAGLTTSFELINPHADSVAPVLNNVSISSNTYTVGSDDHIILNADISDDLSGGQYFYFYFTNEAGESFSQTANNNGDFSVNMGQLENRSTGTWTLSSVSGYDRAENWVEYSTEDLAVMQINVSFDILEVLEIENSPGEDLLVAGDGIDSFIFDQNWGDDAISSFAAGTDIIDMSLTDLTFSDILQTVQADGLMITSGQDSILIEGLTEALPTNSFRFWVSDDGTGPELTSVSVSGTTFDRDDIGAASDHYITIEATDDLSNVNYFNLYYHNEAGASIVVTAQLYYGYTGRIRVDEGTDTGTYTLYRAIGVDTENYRTDYNADQLAEMGISSSFEVTSSNPDDVTAPVLDNLAFSATTYEAGSSATLMIEGLATDDMSGVENIRLQFLSAEGEYYYVYLNAANDFNGSIFLDAWTPASTFTLKGVYVWDSSGNAINYSQEQLTTMGLDYSFDVTNDGPTDTEAPILNGFELEQGFFDAGGANNPLVGHIDATEDVSGLSYWYAYYQGPTGETIQVSNWTGTNAGPASVNPEDHEAGVYTLTKVYVMDRAGNSYHYQGEELAELGIESDFRLINSGPQPGTAVEGTDDVDALTGTADDELFTLGLGEDTLELGEGFGHDTLRDFVQGDDVLDFSGTGLTYEAFEFTQTSHGLFIEDGQGNDILLRGFEGDLDSGDIVFATVEGTVGDDTIDVGAHDTVVAGEGNDVLNISEDDFESLDGGAGHDTLHVSQAHGGDFDVAELLNEGRLSNFEVLDFTNEGHDNIELTANNIIALTGDDNVLYIMGDEGDALTLTDRGWVADDQSEVDGVIYDTYTQDDVTVYVDPSVDSMIL